jgi:hypothetical protein
MEQAARRIVQASIASFVSAKEAMEAEFGLVGAPAIVHSVLKGTVPRQGKLRGGSEYFVHGIGYTVVFSDEGQAHIDGSDLGDLFSVYDLSFYMETSGVGPVSGIEELEAVLDGMVESGELRKAGPKKYFIGSR